MTLAGRISAFFLAVLGLAFVTFCLALYLLARSYLYAQVNERLESALVALTAALEIKPGGIEWEPNERGLNVGLSPDPDQVRWLMLDGTGKTIAESKNLGTAERGAFVSGERDEVVKDADKVAATADVTIGGQTWRVATRGLHVDVTPAASPRGTVQRGPGRNRELLYPKVLLVCGLSLQPIRQALNILLFSSLGLSLAVWLGVALVGRWLSRRALSPLSTMATALHGISANDLGTRLPLPNTRDELQAVGLAFNDLLSRVQQMVLRQQQFTAEASHQLRTPLTALLGHVEVALRHPRNSDEYRAALQVVQRQGAHLTRIVESLLFLARADAEAELPATERVELNAWLREHLTTLTEDLRTDNLQVHFAKEPIVIAMEPLLLGQALDILLDNAEKYSEAGAIIAVRLLRSDNRAMIEVTDSGIGIEDEELERLYEPFFRSARAREMGVPGVGLGLAIARRIVTALGGRMLVRSKVDVGTTFVLEFPIVT